MQDERQVWYNASSSSSLVTVFIHTHQPHNLPSSCLPQPSFNNVHFAIFALRLRQRSIYNSRSLLLSVCQGRKSMHRCYVVSEVGGLLHELRNFLVKNTGFQMAFLLQTECTSTAFSPWGGDLARSCIWGQWGAVSLRQGQSSSSMRPISFLLELFCSNVAKTSFPIQEGIIVWVKRGDDMGIATTLAFDSPVSPALAASSPAAAAVLDDFSGSVQHPSQSNALTTSGTSIPITLGVKLSKVIFLNRKLTKSMVGVEG